MTVPNWTDSGFSPVDGAHAASLARRLEQEVHARHPLAPMLSTLSVLGVNALEPDSILVGTGDTASPFAVVHLTWQSGGLFGLFRARDPVQPSTRFHPSFDAVVADWAWQREEERE